MFGFQHVELDPKEKVTLFFDAGIETFKTVDEEVTYIATVGDIMVFTYRVTRY